MCQISVTLSNVSKGSLNSQTKEMTGWDLPHTWDGMITKPELEVIIGPGNHSDDQLDKNSMAFDSPVTHMIVYTPGLGF